MLQIKTWSWNVNHPHGKTSKDIEKEINQFFRDHTCKPETFEMFYLEHGVMFSRVLYTTRKKR